ncbi:hypothetical protein SAMN05444166_0784 [Singulisphaera sp. GP187]|uniref:hypothetical protein n=1 Tax=Singulisphaera sp. GP187 TaxID=1882752 RepID=UPI00092CE04B|nr:hypothetical protein [Singulisphaera sp. GP187]SIN77698.1 hypothetical protein SAMN05444166_0784 [Singulisphaera sp. GP187]
MSSRVSIAFTLLLTLSYGPMCPGRAVGAAVREASAEPTREFEVRQGRAFLGGVPVRLWGLRCGHALMDQAMTERCVENLDNMAAHGINLIEVYLQGANGGYPNLQAGKNAFGETGDLKPEFAERLEWLVREADKRGMVVLVGFLSPLKDEELMDEAAIRRAIEATARLFETRRLRNVLVDLLYEFDHPRRIDHAIYREPEGAAKKGQVAGWFHAIAPRIEVGITTAAESKAPRDFPGMDVRLIQKGEAIPSDGFVVNVESTKGDEFDNDGVFTPAARDAVRRDCERFLAAPNSALVFNSAFSQGITNWSGTAPHFEMGGDGTGPDDRGVRFYYNWVRDHAGRWQYPRHVKADPEVISELPTPTREFEIRNDRAFLGGQEVDLWGLRCANALMSQAVAERHVRALDNMVEHGINLIGVYVQGSNPGWPNLLASKNGYTAEGQLKPEIARRLEWIVREADKRGMVVMVGLCSPRKDQEFRDEEAVKTAVQETARFLVRRKLKNVFVDIMHEYNHPARITRDIFREPEGPEKKAKLTAWFRAEAPDIEAGVCPTWNPKQELQSADSYPGMQVRIIQKEAPIPPDGFVVNVETHRLEPYSHDGIFTTAQLATMRSDFDQYKAAPNAVMLFHSGYCMGITNESGTAPHPEMGGDGTGPDDRGIRFYFNWVRDDIGRWEYPKHVNIKKVSRR